MLLFLYMWSINPSAWPVIKNDLELRWRVIDCYYFKVYWNWFSLSSNCAWISPSKYIVIIILFVCLPAVQTNRFFFSIISKKAIYFSILTYISPMHYFVKKVNFIISHEKLLCLHFLKCKWLLFVYYWAKISQAVIH